MKTAFFNRHTALHANESEKSIQETKDTVAVAANIENATPIFTAANLWNIHNQRRIRTTGRVFVS